MTGQSYTLLPVGAKLKVHCVEVAVHNGLPDFHITGLPGSAAGAAKIRVRASLKSAGFKFPVGRVSVSITPSVTGVSAAYAELSIAQAVLHASGQVNEVGVAVGRLGVSGFVEPVHYGHAAYATAQADARSLYMAGGTGQFLRTVLSQACVLNDVQPTHKVRQEWALDRIRGNEAAKRVLLIALAGRHPLILSGPPGSGKTELAYAAHELLPRLDAQHEQLLTILEAQYEQVSSRAYAEPPFHLPAQTLTARRALAELELSAAGLLFFDELPMYKTEVLNMLRIQLDHRAREQLGSCIVAARNYCPCGRTGSHERCTCSQAQRHAYAYRLSAPLLERFHLEAEVIVDREVPTQLYAQEVAERIVMARQAKQPFWSSEYVEELEQLARRLGMSFRAQANARAVATTIAKLEQTEQVRAEHLQEALQYRLRPVSL